MKAVVFIDVQNDFVTGALANPDAQVVLPKIVEFAKECVKYETMIYATMDTHRAPESFFCEHTIETVTLPKHCIEGTNGWSIVPELSEVIQRHANICEKKNFGSLDLASQIMQYGKPDEIELCGFCTDICVISNALILSAMLPDVRITVRKDLCAGTTRKNHEAALRVMKSCLINVK